MADAELHHEEAVVKMHHSAVAAAIAHNMRDSYRRRRNVGKMLSGGGAEGEGERKGEEEHRYRAARRWVYDDHRMKHVV